MPTLNVQNLISCSKDIQTIVLSSDQMTLLTLYLSYKNRKLAISDNNIIHLIPIHKIVMIKADGNYSTIYITEGHEYLTSKTVKYWQSKIDHPYFFRTHKSYLVNLQFINKYNISESMVMLSDKSIPVARDKKSKLRALLHNQNVTLKANFSK